MSDGTVQKDASTSIDDASFALSSIRSTLLIIGTRGPNGPHFMIANWGTQASFDPWRYVLALKKTAHTREYAKSHDAFTVNLVDPSQRALVQTLLKTKGEGHAAEDASVDAPRLPEAFAGFECKLLDVIDTGGDHVLTVSDIVGGWKKGEGPAATLGELKLSYSG